MALEPYAPSCRQPEVVAEECVRGAAVPRRRPRIFEQAIAQIAADKSPRAGRHLAAPADIEREHGALTELTRQRGRKDQDAHGRPCVKREEARPHSGEQTRRPDVRSGGDAEQAFHAMAAAPARAGKRPGKHVHFRFDPDEVEWMPREAAPHAGVGRVEFAGARDRDLPAGVERLLRRCRSGAAQQQEEDDDDHLAPSCCIIPSMSASRQCSAILPSRMWKMCVSEIVYSLPVAGIPMKSPACFPWAVTRTATLSSSAIMSSILKLTPVSPACTRRVACFSGSMPAGILPQLCGVKSEVTSLSTASALPLANTSSTKRRTRTLFS